MIVSFADISRSAAPHPFKGIARLGFRSACLLKNKMLPPVFSI